MEDLKIIPDTILSKSVLKPGDEVSLKLDPDKTFVVAIKDGQKCLKMAGCLGWIYLEPENWNAVIFKYRP